MALKLFLFLFLLKSGAAYGDIATPLDHDYGTPRTPVVVEPSLDFENFSPLGFARDSVLSANLTNALAHTSVKSQGRRGTCSMFSTSAVLEHELIRRGLEESTVNLSEQWIEYITAGQRGQEGSWSNYNFNRFGRYGYLYEQEWAYNPTSWHPYKPEYWENSASAEELELFEQTCGNFFETTFFDHCLIGQENPHYLDMNETELLVRDEEFLVLRTLGQQNMNSKIRSLSAKWYGQSNTIQEALDNGVSLALDVTFFYEAWNHRKAEDIGLIRDYDLWAQGVVSYPHPDSMDYKTSRESDNRAGHSVALVGYDANVEITREVLGVDGEIMTVTTRGVYYFKNSWGTESFGEAFQLEGYELPGFGMIAMDYAHEHGTFYGVQIQQIPEGH